MVPALRAGSIVAAALAVSALVVAVSAVLWATPAAAHTAGGSDSSGFRPEFTDAGADCLHWDVLGGDGYLRLRSDCPGTVVVFGYQDEPYLEFSPSGVRENRNSPATYLNTDARAETRVPATATPEAAPDWVQRADVPEYAWHDHRIHWMSDALPEQAGGARKVTDWAIPMWIDDDAFGWDPGRSATARGELYYDPPVSPWLPLVLAAVPVIAVLAVALARGLRGPDSGAATNPTLVRPVAALIAVIAGLTLVTAVEDLVRAAGAGEPWVPVAVVTVAITGGSFWAALRGRRGDLAGVLALLGAGASLSWAFGQVDVGLLRASALLSGLPPLFVRWVVALQLLAVIPPFVVLVAGRVAQRRARGGTGGVGAAGGTGKTGKTGGTGGTGGVGGTDEGRS